MKKLKPNQFLLACNLITELPLLFQTEMVKANLEDRKTQTRRTTKPNRPVEDFEVIYKVAENDYWIGTFKSHFMGHSSTRMKCPYGQRGDLLWVRETFCPPQISQHDSAYLYKADFPNTITEHPNKIGMWKPSIHMPKSASRLWLMVEEIRVERVQNISESDSIAEGCKQYDEKTEWLTAKSGFEELWKSINGSESWDQNPWVWVIKYRILSKTGRPSDDIILQNYQEVTSHKALLGV